MQFSSVAEWIYIYKAKTRDRKSLCEDDKLDLQKILSRAPSIQQKTRASDRYRYCDEFKNDANKKTVSIKEIPAIGWEWILVQIRSAC